MRRFLPLFLIFISACQTLPESDPYIQKQIDLELSERDDLIVEFEKKEFINPVRYKEYRLYASKLSEFTDDILNKLNQTDYSSTGTDSLNYYFDWLSSIIFPFDNSHTYLNNQKQFCHELIEESKILDVNVNHHLQLSIVRSQNYCLRNLLEDPTRGNFSFNKIYPVVIENSKVLKRGEGYRARILMAAVDTLAPSITKVKGHTIEINNNGESVLNIKTDKSGSFIWEGELIWMNNFDGIKRVFNIGSDYTVE
nr:hypothetical protein [uncultured Carboxylicivirga sp.]